MKKRFRIVFGILLLLVVGGIAWLTLRSSEPLYKGKPLSAWLEAFDKNYDFIGSTENMDRGIEASEAVRHIGTNAIPTLLRRLRAKDNPLADRLYALAQKQHFVAVEHVPAYLRRTEGRSGFRVLGPEGRAAVPALMKLYGSVSPECRPCIAATLGGIGPDAKRAVPLLIRGLAETNTFHGEVEAPEAANALGKIHSEPQLAVPALIKCLGNQNPIMRWEAAGALGNFGAEAKSAVPALLKLLNDSVPYVSRAARGSLDDIEPGAAEKAGVK